MVGAGFAGCLCAWLLRLTGARVTLLEARNRVGGRIHSLQHLAFGRVIEDGGEFIGGVHLLWIELVRLFAHASGGRPGERLMARISSFAALLLGLCLSHLALAVEPAAITPATKQQIHQTVERALMKEPTSWEGGTWSVEDF